MGFREWLIKNKITLITAAKDLNYSYSQVVAVAAGKRNPSFKLSHLIYKYTNGEVDFLKEEKKGGSYESIQENFELTQKLIKYTNVIDDFLRKKSLELCKSFPDEIIHPKVFCISVLTNLLGYHGFETICASSMALDGIFSVEDYAECIKKSVLETIHSMKVHAKMKA